jgi:hypothetical protein
MAYGSRRTNPYGLERNSLGGSGDGPGDEKKKSGPKKASPEQKKYIKEVKKAVKDKPSKDPVYGSRVAAGTGPLPVTGPKHSKSGVESYNKSMDAKRAAMETKSGQKVMKLEQKKMKKDPSYGAPHFQPSTTAHKSLDPSKVGTSRGQREKYGVDKWERKVGSFKKKGLKGY